MGMLKLKTAILMLLLSSKVFRRQLSPKDLREVWVYHVQDRDLLTNHLYPKLHLIVFSNGVMLAQDPTNPYAARNQF